MQWHVPVVPAVQDAKSDWEDYSSGSHGQKSLQDLISTEKKLGVVDVRLSLQQQQEA
jgi:hypothetical protein